ncbi:putative staphylococcal-like nuclease CAN1 [Curcuma longa]|uniref:putative staphylococcal-like nuclease CAN1 n=1 Tax=Curcuma longa TaxID=136217 RepID=UPI003D9E91B2
MGNSLLKCFRGDCNDAEPQVVVVQVPVRDGVAVLAQDLFSFEITSQVPQGLDQRVAFSKEVLAIWYKQLLEAWKKSKPTPKTPTAAASLIVQTLRRYNQEEVEKLLNYYDLPIPSPYESCEKHADTTCAPSSSVSLPQGVQFVLFTLPVNAKDVGDGDGVTAYVDTADPRESADVPAEVHEAVFQRIEARAGRNFREADRLKKCISDAGYVFKKNGNGEEILARKYRIRLRGVDAPESQMPYGKEAKDELAKLVQGKCLRIDVYNIDHFGRHVGDIYCNGVFIQEKLLKRGFAWHFEKHDKRPEFAKWQQQARAAGRGLWASSNPEKPWEWRKSNPGWRQGNPPIEVC